MSSPTLGCLRLASSLLAVVVLTSTTDVTAEDEKKGSVSEEELKRNWPSFRGLGSNGNAAHANPPLKWSVKESKNVVWKTPIAKHGMSSPVVWKERLFLTGADDESRDIYCFNAKTGKLVWDHVVRDLPGSPKDGLLPDVLDETGFAAPTVIVTS